MYKLGEELLGHIAILCLTFRGTAKLFKLFSMVVARFYIPTSNVEDSNFSTSLTTVVILHFQKLLAILVGVKLLLIVVLICISLMINDVEHTFNLYIFFGEMSI